jgi:hypothetical protein
MSDLDAIRIAVHENNINRYRRLLRTRLTEIEREYVERRLGEERHALALLVAPQGRVTQHAPPGRRSAPTKPPNAPRTESATVIAAA